MTSSRLLISSFLTLVLSGCSSFEIADVRPMVTLPASGDCYGRNVVSLTRVRIPKAQCEEIKKRAIFITSEDWKKQRISIQKNCQHLKCKQLIGAFDELFLTIDKALQKIP